jgi:putative MATE family efflux protein
MLLANVLGVAETYFVSAIGTDAIAAASLVVPVLLLMTMVANGGIGGGVASAIARASGAAQHDLVNQLLWHVVVLAILCGGAFTLVLWALGPVIYAWLGGSGAALDQAVVYSNILFGGAILSWSFALLQSALRGTGNAKTPALIMTGSVVLGLLISPPLISGWWGLPRLGVVGAGMAQVITNAVGLAVLVTFLWRGQGSVRLRPHALHWQTFWEILRIGMLSSLNAMLSNVAVACITACAGQMGNQALAGFGIAARLDGLLIPVLFGFGTAALTLVGKHLGAGRVSAAKRVALVNALSVAAALQILGLLVALWPNMWMQWFTQDTRVLEYGATYLRWIGPTYGLLGLTLELYFAGQGAGRIGWPLAATVVRTALACASLALAIAAHAPIQASLALVAAGIAGAAALSLAGFRVSRWTR